MELITNELLILAGSLAIAASIAGFLAGLLGIGGGIILVPALYSIFTFLGYPEDNIMHMSIATALAATIFTTMSSSYAHYKHKAINTEFLKIFAPAIIFGVIIGTILANHISSNGLLLFFGLMLCILAFMMLADPSKIANKIPKLHKAIHLSIGSLIGCCSTLLGIGGATFNVPYMVLNNICIRNAVATASTLALCVAVPGTIGFFAIGYEETKNIPYMLGYINWLCWLIIVPITVLIAPIGAKAAHTINTNLLRKSFAIIMIIISIKMLYSYFG